ncbi:uncharacterized protein LOC118103530 isoform X1 [Hippoglossus stenolepis]|uniref:uncharacterized protein LOC118103530 isoform X1 n=1 Tax=Hippoglossus stenolepis TaxID=195615 RepID=UPI00159C3821|nr:uncharacterized protein LOC118103530 isoform X1 [Hippoglossus stenolepis]
MVVVVVVCAEALQVTKVKKVKLGQNVTLTCSESGSYPHWSMEIYSQLNCCIGQAMNDVDVSFSCHSFKSKFSLHNNSLTISNVSADDCRRYFCSRKTSGSFVDINTFLLVSDVVSTTSCNMSEARWPNSPVMYASLSLNIVFIVTMSVIGSWLCLKNRLWVNDRSPVAHTPETPQYEEIQFYSSSVLPPAAPECVYYKAQLPAPH